MTHFFEIDDEDPTKILLARWDKRFREQYSTIPSARYRKNRDNWVFNLTWPVCLALKESFGEDLDIGENLQKWTADFYNNTIMPAYYWRDKTEAEFPEYTWQGRTGKEESLFPHQKADIQFLSNAKRAILANDMGTGKTTSSFSSIRALYEQGHEVFPLLIACPNSTKHGWKREIDKMWPGLKVAVVEGTAAKRRKVLEDPSHVYIINWESLRMHSKLKPFGSTASKKCTACGGLDSKVTAAACEVHEKELNRIDFKSAIGDEAHRLKDPASKVSRAFKAASGDAQIRFALTGTPIASTPDDLFSILNWLYPEAYTSKRNFLDRYCELDYNPWGATVVKGIKRGMEREFFGGLDPILRRMSKEVILDFLPPVLRERRDVEMAAKQKKAYEQMRDQMVAELDDDEVVVSTSPLTRMTRMLQFAAAFGEIEYTEIYDPETKEFREKPNLKLSDPSCKLDAFMDDIDDFGDESVIVFASSKQLINLLSARLAKANIPHGLITGDQDAAERQVHMDDFQEGRSKFILCTIQAGGTGITLTKGSYMVFLQRSWSMIDNLQAEARGHRIGSEQHDHVQIVDYVTSDTIEEMVFEAIESKSDQLETILRDKDLMKKHLKGEK